MANYIPWYGKKRARLADREHEFAALLLQETNETRLAEGAESVRAAQIRALKARRAQLAPAEKNAESVENLDHEIQSWLGLTGAEIIEGYRDGKLRGFRAPLVRRVSR
jgi:hypothetical protein